MTYTATSTIAFVSTSATVQTVDFAGKTTGSVTFNAASNGSWQYTGTHNTGTTDTVNLTKGSLDINNQTCSWGIFDTNNTNTRALTLGTANITCTSTGTAWGITTSTGLTLSAASSILTLSGTNATMNGGASKTYGTINFTGSGAATYGSSSVTAGPVTRTGTAARNDSFVINGAKTITGTWTVNGNSATNRMLMTSNGTGTSVTITNSGATMAWSNVDVMDITLGTSYNASAIAGGCGDAGGCTNITFTTAATQTWSGTSGGNWSANAWTTRVPLPQDDVVISAAFSASQTVTADMPRMGKSISWVGSTGTPIWNNNSTATTIYGSLTLIAGMAITGTSSTSFRGRSSFTITSAGQALTQSINILAPGGTFTLQDAFSTAGGLTLTYGAFIANNFNVTCPTFNSSTTNIRTLTMGTGTWSLTSTAVATIWNLATTTGLTFSGASATIAITGVSASTKTFAGGSLTYGTLTYTIAGSTAWLYITGANTFTTFNNSDATNARTLTLPSGVTNTFTNWNVNGGPGRVMTLQSSTPGTPATISKSSGSVTSDYMSIKDSAATGGASWRAGPNSTDVSGNSGWIFDFASSEAPAGTEQPVTSTSSASTSDAPTGTESFSLAATATPTETATAAEAVTIIAVLTTADATAAAEAVTAAAFINPTSDSCAGGDATTVSTSTDLSDSATGGESNQLTATTAPVTDTSEGSDSAAFTAQVSTADSSSATDLASLGASANQSDATAGLETASGTATVTTSDSASAVVETHSTEQSSDQVSVEDYDFAAASETAQITFLTLETSDSSAGQDSAMFTAQTLNFSDVSSGSDNASPAASIISVDSSAAADSNSLPAAVVSVSDVSSNQETTSALATLSETDNTVAQDSPSIVVGTSDTASLSEVAAITAALSNSDSSVAQEAAQPANASSSASDSVTAVDSAVVITTLSLTTSDSSSATESMSVSECFPGSGVPAGAMCDVAPFPSMLGSPTIRHLYSSRVAVYRLLTTIVDGGATMSWKKLTTNVDPILGVAGEMKCRIDLMFVRPGKDQPMALVAGRAQDRTGVLYCDSTTGLKAGDQVRCLTGPVVGTFELRGVPELALGYSGAHHAEVQVVETAQSLDLEASRQFPATEPYEA